MLSRRVGATNRGPVACTTIGVSAVLATIGPGAGGALVALVAVALVAVAPAAVSAIATSAANSAAVDAAGRIGNRVNSRIVERLPVAPLTELGRRDRPQMYGLTGVQRPLVPRDLRWEVRERTSHNGEVIEPLDLDGVRGVAEALLDADVESVAVSFLHSYANPSHEQEACRILREANPDWHVVASSDVLREYYEFERTSTTVIQGYLQPLVTRYAAGLQEKLDKWNFRKDVLVMQSNGGVVTVERMPERAAHFIRSGPAAGVVAAASLAAEAGFPNIITADMGGTSFDVAVVREGTARVAETTYLDFRVPLRLPMLDVHTIGAGGGSIAYVDRGGVLQVGPRSAGSYPGPICFRHGGSEPTVTDANLVLGRIDAARPIGGVGGTGLDVDGARKAFEDLGALLHMSPEEAAEAVLAVVNQRMAGRIRLLSVEQGQDPRAYAMVAFGGAGPLHGSALIRDVGISAMLVPPTPGVLCALGCAIADVQYDYGQTVHAGADGLSHDDVVGVLDGHAAQGREQLLRDGVSPQDMEVRHFADMAYQGQIHSLRVPVERDWSVKEMAGAFMALYRKEYGPPLGELAVMVENLRTTVLGKRRLADRAAAPLGPPDPPAPVSQRDVFFGGWETTAVYTRDQLLPGMRIYGPAVIEQADTTTVVEPGMTARVDGFSNLIVEVS